MTAICGISGFKIAPGDLGRMDTRAMTAVLAYEMKSRGTDATGVATVDSKGRWKVRKQPVPADVFVAGRQGIGRNAMTALIHTRMATQGKPSIPGNNHPIVHGSIVGIHNGIVYNDDKLFAHFKWPRHAQVDSEAIFAALNYLPLDEALANIDAGWAIGWFDTDNDPRKLWLARGQHSPLHYAMTKEGSIVFASTETAVIEAFEWGGVDGKPNVTCAPEGFLAHTNEGGGITILPKFDGSGDKAIGGRPPKTTYTYNGASHGGMYNSWDDEWPARPPTPHVREQISGDKAKPVVGDRRRFIDTNRVWHTEVCTKAFPNAVWQRLIPTPSTTTPATIRKADSIPLSTEVMAANAIAGGVPTEVVEWRERLKAVEAARTDKEAAVPFDDEDFNETVRFGYAGIGDLIAVEKSSFGGGEGAIVGIVVDEDPISGQLVVEWRTGRIDHNAFYEVMIPASKGA